MRLPVTVPRDVAFQVQTGDVADTAVSDLTVESNDTPCPKISDTPTDKLI